VQGLLSFNETINCEKYLRADKTAFSTSPVICELQLLHFKRYRPLGMLIHRKNSHASGRKQRTARREARRRELVKLLKEDPVLLYILIFTFLANRRGDKMLWTER
jgi:hypothetical protein